MASYILILIGSSPSACLSIVIYLLNDKILLVSTSLGIRARANKSNSPSIDWRYRWSIDIGLFFRFNIVASKEYCLTIIGSLKA